MSFGSFDNVADNIRANASVAQTYAFNFNSGGVPDASLTQSNTYSFGYFKNNKGETDYLYCSAKFSTPEAIIECLGLDPSKINLLYFASSFIPGILS